MRQAILLVVALGGLLAFAIWQLWDDWAGRDLAMNGHAWTALALGAGLSLALGAGLMALVFHSARRGYDDRLPPDPEG